MQVKVSKHVDVAGKIYLPYLHEWVHPNSNLLRLVQICFAIFNAQPPVCAKSTQSQNLPYHPMYTPQDYPSVPVRRDFWMGKKEHLDPDNGIPTDVTLLIEDVSGVEVELKAHKFCLSVASPVFRQMFYGSLKECRETIPIEDSTKEAFEAMIAFVYEVDIDWKAKTEQELFNILNLAKKYIIEEMSEYLEKVLGSVDLSLDTVVKSAAIAVEFSHFEEHSEILLTRCAKFIKSQLTTATSCFSFVARYSDTDLAPYCNILFAKANMEAH